MKTEHNQIVIRIGCLVLALILSSLMLAGCSAGYRRDPRLADLSSNDTALRIRAIRWAADNGRVETGPQLVSMLLDEDRSVRFYAIQALEKLYGTRREYDYKASVQDRLAAVKLWREALGLATESDEKDNNPIPLDDTIDGQEIEKSS